MKMLRARRPRSAMQGMSLVELMIAMTLGLIILAALVSVFANTSSSRAELERTSRQIENGRFAIELLSEDLRHAGFYGETNVKAVPVVSGPLQDPCEIADMSVWHKAMPLHVQAYDLGAGLPWCFAGARKLNTDILVVRRVATCEAGVGDCPGPDKLQHYIQVARCAKETAVTPFKFGIYGVDDFNLHNRDCTTPANLRRYYIRFYYIRTVNDASQNIPTLTRIDLDGQGFTETPMVEGIEEINFEYGIDTDAIQDGAPDLYTADPTTVACPVCTSPSDAWSRVVTVRINLLARNVEPSPHYTDTKTYTLGRDATGTEIEVTPHDEYRRHAYSALIRIVNAGERWDTP